MKSILQLLFLRLVPALVGASSAVAGPAAEIFDPLHFCVPVDLVAEPIVSCEDNPAFAQAADDCIKKYEDHFARRRLELEQGLHSNLDQRVTAKTVSHQQGNFANSGLDYTQTKAALLQLSELGRQAQGEISGYRTNLKLAFHWPQDEPFPDLEDPELEDYFSSDECYGESNARIRAVQARLAQMLADVDRAQAGSSDLSDRTLAKAGTIGARPGGGSVLAGNGGGKPHQLRQGKSASDITGLREDLAKRKKSASGKVYASAVTGLESTGSESSGLETAASLTESSEFSLKGSLVATVGSASRAQPGSFSGNGAGGNIGNPSLGELVWSKPGESQDGALELLAENAGIEKAARHKQGSPEGMEPANQREAAQEFREPASVAVLPQSLASAEQSIFRTISLRYRSTELFRSVGVR